MKSLLALLLLFSPTLGRGTTVSMGGTSIDLPSPPGFAEVTPQMTKAYDLGQQLVPPTNLQLASYITETEVAKALRGEMPDFTRRFSVQSVKTLENRSASTADFAQMRQVLRTQNDDILKKLQASAPALLDGLSQNLSKHYDTKLALSLSQMVPFPPHEETEQSFAYSVLVKYAVGVGSSGTKESISANTLTLIHLKNKVLFIYCVAEEGGLDWTRESSTNWANAILAANPYSPFQDLLAQVSNAFEWKRVRTMTFVGGGIGLAVGLLSMLVKRR